MCPSLSRTVRILTELGEGEPSLVGLAEKLGVHKTTVLRLLQVLEADRFVSRDVDHRYRLGSRSFAPADTALEQHTVRDVAAQHLLDLSRRTAQAVHLAAYRNGAAIYIDKVEGHHSVRMYSHVGLPATLHCTAVGKVLVAGMTPGKRDATIAGIEFSPFTDDTITDPAAFKAEVEDVRLKGSAQVHSEREPLIDCIGAPVLDPAGRVVAAGSVSVPEVPLGCERVLQPRPDLLETTAQIHLAYDPGTGSAPRREAS